METFSDGEFYEARDDISSVSGSESPDNDALGKQKCEGKECLETLKQNQAFSEWIFESRFSVWQEGPKSVDGRRRLLYEQFGILGRTDERTEGGHTGLSSRVFLEGGKGWAPIPVTRFGTREPVLPAGEGLGKGRNSPVDAGASEFGVANKNGLVSTEGLVSVNPVTPGQYPRCGGDIAPNSADVELVILGLSTSDSATFLLDGNMENSGRTGFRHVAYSASASSQTRTGIEWLMQTSEAVQRVGKWESSNWKPPACSRSTGASKSASSISHSLAIHGEKRGSGTGSVLDMCEAHPNNANGSSVVTPTPRYLGTTIKSSSGVVIPSSSKSWASGETDTSQSHGHISSNSIGSLVRSIENIVDAEELVSARTSPFEDVNDINNKIKDLDSGKEFILNELGTDGDPKLRELDTGRELTLEEFETTLGLSPLMQEVRRRERVNDNLDGDGDDRKRALTAPDRKKKSLWVRTMKGVAKTVRVSKTKSHHNPSTVQNEGGRGESGGEDREGQSNVEDSVDKAMKIHLTRAKRLPDDSPHSLRPRLSHASPHPPRSPQRVKVQVFKKSHKALSDLNMGQEFQAHEGAIWTMKFSLDGRYLASAGQDGIVQVREILDHPLLKDQGGRDGVLEFTGVKHDGIGTGSSEHSHHSAEGTQDRRGSLLGAVGKGKSVKTNLSSKLPKLFWLSETALCSFKGHTEDVLDLSWSRSQFLLSSSMDKTVRLWHISYGECLRVFTHSDYVTSIDFSPIDDHYFLSGSLDDKVRIWSIPDHQVVDWSDVREMVTAASYSHDGKRAAIGTYKGTCRFYNTTGHKLQLDGKIEVRNTQAKKSPGKKITGLQFVPGDANKVLITSNDSRIRVYDGMVLTSKFKGLRNVNSQISATFNRTGEYIISASEDSRVYLWNSSLHDFGSGRKDKPQSYEHFPSNHVSIALPWPGLAPKISLGIGKGNQTMNTFSSQQSAHDRPLRLPIRCSPCGSSSSRSNSSTHSEWGLTNESMGECKSEQSVMSLGGNDSGRDMVDEEVTSMRSDPNGSLMVHYNKPQAPVDTSFQDSFTRNNVQPEASSPALSISNQRPPLVQSSVRSTSPTFSADITSKTSTIWPKEKHPLPQGTTTSQGASWNTSSPSEEILSIHLSPEGSTTRDATAVAVASWGLVIVTAGLGGEIRTFQNYGYPIWL